MEQLLFTIFSLLTLTLNAQSIDINWAEDDYNSYNGQTVEISSETDVIYTDFYVVNHSPAVSFIWERKILSQSGQNFGNELCDNQLCHIPTGIMWTASVNMPVATGDSTLLQPKLLTNGVGGTAHHRYYVLDQSSKMMDSVDVIFNSTLDVTQNKLTEKDIVLYPNPSQGDVTLKMKGDFNHQSFDVVFKDALGKVVHQSSLTSGSNTTVNGLNKGVYFAVIQSLDGQDIITKKVVVR